MSDYKFKKGDSIRNIKAKHNLALIEAVNFVDSTYKYYNRNNGITHIGDALLVEDLWEKHIEPHLILNKIWRELNV